MDVNLENISNHWFKAVLVAGLGILVAAIIANDDPFRVIGLGVLLWGAGEFINHPYNPSAEKGHTKRTRSNSLWGCVVTGGGLILLGVGLLLLLAEQKLI